MEFNWTVEAVNAKARVVGSGLPVRYPGDSHTVCSAYQGDKTVVWAANDCQKVLTTASEACSRRAKDDLHIVSHGRFTNFSALSESFAPPPTRRGCESAGDIPAKCCRRHNGGGDGSGIGGRCGTRLFFNRGEERGIAP